MKLPRRPWTPIPAFLFCLSVCIPAHAWSSGGTGPDGDVAHGAGSAAMQMVSIPGPLRSFMRMAGISQEATPEEMLPLLARNVSLHGYQVGSETEYLVLLRRYVQFAQDLRQLADAQNAIHADNCEQAAKLVEVLGYQFDPACGEKNAYLVTANAERAFLAIDSGFPITGLEDALQKHTPFAYSFPATQVPVLFRSQDWTSASIWRHKGDMTLVDVMLHDQELDRLYWALSKNDEETRLVLRQSRGLKSLLPLAPALEFYGSQVSVRAGRVAVPGGPDAEKGWEELVGASPNSPGEFIEHMCARDHGWLAAYFDALSRVSREQQVHLTSGSRLKQLYDCLLYTSMLLDEHTIFSGVNYTEAHILITGKLVVAAALVVGAAIAALNSLKWPKAQRLVVAVVPAVFVYRCV